VTGNLLVDGQITPSEWDSAAAISLSRDHRDRLAKPQAKARLQCDDHALCVAVEMPLAEGKSLREGTEWGKNDAVEVAVRARPDGPILILHGYTDGTIRAATTGGMSAEDVRQAREATTYAAHVHNPAHWSVEIRIPWERIPGVLPGVLPTELQFNVTCRRPAENLWIMWQPTGRKSYGVGPEGVLEITNP